MVTLYIYIYLYIACCLPFHLRVVLISLVRRYSNFEVTSINFLIGLKSRTSLTYLWSHIMVPLVKPCLHCFYCLNFPNLTSMQIWKQLAIGLFILIQMCRCRCCASENKALTLIRCFDTMFISCILN